MSAVRVSLNNLFHGCFMDDNATVSDFHRMFHSFNVMAITK